MFFILTILIVSACLIGDSVLKITKQDLVRAFVDSFTHSVVAILSWLIVLLKCHQRSTLIINSLFELLLCGFLASIIDIDHFILAKSFKLKNALSLGKRRPLLHCTTIALVILLLCLTGSWIWDSPKLWRFGWLTWISFFSHHLRDGSRRGIWLWPFGSSSPLPHYLYILLTLIIPYLVMIPLREQKKLSVLTEDYITV